MPRGALSFVFSKKVSPFVGRLAAWKPGGLGRLRSVLVNEETGAATPLTVCDADGIDAANPNVIVLADTTPDPTLPPGEIRSSIRNSFNSRTPNYLAANRKVTSFPPGQIEMQREAAKDYYRKVGTDPDGSGPTIDPALNNLSKFINRYFPLPCQIDKNIPCHPDDDPEQTARYFNKGDLGIGREMHCINRGAAKELACYVKNLAGLTGPRSSTTRAGEAGPFGQPSFRDRRDGRAPSNGRCRR